MPVAKSFANLTQITEPYYIDGKQYVKVQNSHGFIRQVRWYTDYEYAKMYNKEEISKDKKLNKKDALGFMNGYITIFKGNTYALKDWLKNQGAKYKPLWGWYFPSDVKLPERFPEGIEPKKLLWDDVCNPLGSDLAAKGYVEAAVATLIYDPCSSEYVGKVGERIDVVVRVERKSIFNGVYGLTNIYKMIDEDGNVYSWFTTTSPMEPGKNYVIRGTIKEHATYRNIKQTILSRCKVIGVEACERIN